MVGAVLVREGRILAEGHYSRWGTLHAEQDLFKKFDQVLRPEDVLYVNLEPCVSFAGKRTPSCTELLIQKGLKQVVIGMLDPDLRVYGKGVAALKNAGVDVCVPLLQNACAWLNRGYVALRTKGRPWVTLKRAQNVGGTTKGAHRRFMITEPAQDRWAHRHLRATHDAILVGVETVVADNPSLTVRHGVHVACQPLRIILDPTLRVPLEAKVCSQGKAKTMIIVGSGYNDPLMLKKRAELEKRGLAIVDVPLQNHGLFDFDALFDVLMSARGDCPGMSSILVEGGAKTWKTFTEAGCIDMEVTLVG
jgi:diaminohydroxyphosphoribosylaminopyrimidine deaminase/5-amino-6-(5-phosphoribosylamino)uracil reductase